MLILGSGNSRPQYPYDMWYGVEGDTTSQDYKLKRVGNMDLHRTLPIQNKLRRYVENPDGSVRYYLHQNDSRKKDGGATANLDTTDGNVMLEIPEYYFKLEVSGTKWIYAISEYNLPGFIKMERKAIAPWYSTIDINSNVAVTGCFLTWSGNDVARDSNGFVVFTSNAAQFRGGAGAGDAAKDGTYNSQLGMARTSITRTAIRSYCKNGTHNGSGKAYMQIAWLQRIEYASLNCQDTYNEALTPDGFHQGGLGSGCNVNGNEWNTWGGYKPFIPGGITAPLGNNTGKVSFVVKGWTGGDKVVQVTSYRGFEVPFEYLYMWADDILVYYTPAAADNRSEAYVCDDPSKFSSPADLATTVPNGYELISELPKQEGYALHFGISSKGYTFPISVGGAPNKGTTDYFSRPGGDANGWYGALLSGAAHYGAFAGFGILYTWYRSSYADAHIGFRLCRF